MLQKSNVTYLLIDKIILKFKYMFTKQKNVSKEQSLLEKSKKITNSFTTMISELRSLNTELSNLEAQKEEEITKLIETKNGLANQRVSNEKLADNLSKLFE